MSDAVGSTVWSFHTLYGIYTDSVARQLQHWDLKTTWESASLNTNHVVKLVISMLVLFKVSQIFYNLYFHPLRRFPGPWLFATSRLFYAIRLSQGRISDDVDRWYAKYGPVIRVAPDELAFCGPNAMKGVYGRQPGAAPHDELMKTDHAYRIKDQPLSIINEDRDNHARLRKLLAPAFSERGIRDQESIIQGFIDTLIRKLRETHVDRNRVDPATGLPVKNAVDITDFYIWTTLDIISDLSFGEEFGALERMKSKGMVQRTRFAAWVQALNRLGLERILYPLYWIVFRARREHDQMCLNKIHRRAMLASERPDLVGPLLKGNKDLNLTLQEVARNAATIVLAGSETSSTVMAGLTYMLFNNPECMKKLINEIRQTFKSEDEITVKSVSNLPYLLACINEGMRLYPPIPTGLPRTIPKGGSTICGAFVPEGMIVAAWPRTIYRNEEAWTDPHEFRPERFLNDPRYANDRFDSLQPFSVGRRDCIGRNLAYAEMKLILSRVLFNFDMRLAEGAKSWMDHPGYVFWDRPPLNVYLTEVQR